MPSRRVPPERRKRTEISCDKCKSRKQKCQRPLETLDGDGSHAPCRYCQTHGFECVTTQPRKKRVYSSMEGLGTRLDLLESIVKAFVPEIDTSNIERLRAVCKQHGILLPPPETDLLAPPDRPEDGSSSDGRASHGPQQEELPILRDQQGQTQYIGPASSYVFQLRIRAIFNGGQAQPGQFFLFGSNPTGKAWKAEVSDLGRQMSLGKSPQTATLEESPPDDEDSDDDMSPMSSSMVSVIDGVISDKLVAAYFEHIHSDFPVLHEASFREEYERFCLNPNLLTSEADPTWICSLLCVLLLGRRRVSVETLPMPVGEAAEEHWWNQVNALLPRVTFTSSVSAIQALLLVSLHLNNTNHKDSCWTLTGSAVRIAVAIGLHRDSKGPVHSPLTRELRKRLWWTLYQFELMQVASLDRPSAIDDAACSAGNPRQEILDTASSDSMAYSNRLLLMLSKACRIVRAMISSAEAGEETNSGPLSPVSQLIRDLRRWKDTLPRHLCVDAVSGQPPSSQRAVLLLHVQYYHVLQVLSRNSMLMVASRLFAGEHDRNINVNMANQHPSPHSLKSANKPSMPPSTTLAGQPDTPNLYDVCSEAAQETTQLLVRLNSNGVFDEVVWFDFYFLYNAAQVLVLNIMCEAKQYDTSLAYESRWLSNSRRLLEACCNISQKVLRNPMLPGTTRRFADVIIELNETTRRFLGGINDTFVSVKMEHQSHVAVAPGQGSTVVASTEHSPDHPAYTSTIAPPATPITVTMMNTASANVEMADAYEAAADVDMSQGLSGFHFTHDLPAHLGYPDGLWAWQDAPWNGINPVLLGGEYEPPPQ